MTLDDALRWLRGTGLPLHLSWFTRCHERSDLGRKRGLRPRIPRACDRTHGQRPPCRRFGRRAPRCETGLGPHVKRTVRQHRVAVSEFFRHRLDERLPTHSSPRRSCAVFVGPSDYSAAFMLPGEAAFIFVSQRQAMRNHPAPVGVAGRGPDHTRMVQVRRSIGWLMAIHVRDGAEDLRRFQRHLYDVAVTESACSAARVAINDEKVHGVARWAEQTSIAGEYTDLQRKDTPESTPIRAPGAMSYNWMNRAQFGRSA